jgi:hypothetical protein
MSYDPDDGGVFTAGRSAAEIEADTRAFWGRIARLPWLQIAGWLVVAWLIWTFFGRWLIPLVIVGALATLAYTYRDSPLGVFLRERVWDAFWAFVLPNRRPYRHAFDRAAQTAQRDQTMSELARMADAEASHSVEAGIFLARARPALEARLDQLLREPKPTMAQHHERVALEGWLRADRARAGQLVDAPIGDAPALQALLTPTRESGTLTLVSAFAQKWALWIIGPLLLLLGAQTVRVASLKQDVRARDAALAAAAQSIVAMERRIDRDAERIAALADARADDAIARAEQELANARRLEDERRRRARAEASLRRLDDARSTLGDGRIVDFRDQLRELAPDREGESTPGEGDDPGTADPGL